MAGSFRLTKKLPPPGAQFEAFKAGVKKGLQPVIDRRAGEYAKATNNWQSQHKPDFQGQVVATQKGVSFRVVIRNALQVVSKYGTTIRQLWDFWNEGTKPHLIRPRFATILRFVIGNKVIFTTLVKHPGTKGTKERDKIDKRLRAGEIKAIRREGRLALRRIKG